MTAPSPRYQRRRALVNDLYLLGQQLSARDSDVVARARRILAQLRRLATDNRYAPEAFAFVFEHDPPQAEEPIWLTVAGLFALNPQDSRGARPPRLGQALGILERELTSGAARQRLRQLVASDQRSLVHHLRSALQLLHAHEIPVDFHGLLNDLVVLLDPNRDTVRAEKIQWEWSYQFHRLDRRTAQNQSGAEENDSDDVSDEDLQGETA